MARIRSFIGPGIAVSRACKGVTRRRPRRSSSIRDGSHLVIGATGNIGPHLIRQLADMGAATIVAVSRNPGSRLDELATSLSANGTTLVTVAADAADEAAMSALFDRFGADLPPLSGIYLAAFGGGPVTLRDMTDDDVTTMFRPKLDVVSVLHKLSLQHPVRQFVLFSSISGSDRLSLAGSLRGDHHLPGHLCLCAPSSRAAGHGDQLGTLEVIDRQPNRARNAR